MVTLSIKGLTKAGRVHSGKRKAIGLMHVCLSVSVNLSVPRGIHSNNQGQHRTRPAYSPASGSSVRGPIQLIVCTRVFQWIALACQMAPDWKGISELFNTTQSTMKPPWPSAAAAIRSAVELYWIRTAHSAPHLFPRQRRRPETRG